jgi:hypothetical protein
MVHCSSCCLDKPTQNAGDTIVACGRLQTGAEPLVNTETTTGGEGGEDNTEQNKHAIRPVPFACGKANVQLQRQYGCKQPTEAAKGTEEQTEGDN